MNNELQLIIKEAYKVFESYKRGKILHVCDCCISEDLQQQLLNTPLQEVSGALFEKAYFNTAEIATDQSLEQLKHFLPRVLELLCSFEFCTHSLEVTFYHFRFKEKDKWTEEEQQLLQDFSVAYFRYCLYLYPLPKELDNICDLLVMFGTSHFDITPLLNTWEKSSGVNPILNLADLVYYELNMSKPTLKIHNAFSNKVLSEIFVSWLTSAEVKQKFINEIENLVIHNDLHLEKETESALSCFYDTLSLL